MNDLFMKASFMKDLFMKDLFLHSFISSFLHFPMRPAGPRGGAKWLNSTGFIRFSDMAECHVRFIYKRNAFLIILEALLRF